MTWMLRALVAAMLWAAALAPATAAPPMWTVRGPGGAQVTLFGSVHMLTEDADWRTPALDAALARADTVWFETPFDGDARLEAGRLAAAKSKAPAGRTLSSYLSKADQALLARTASRLGISPQSLEPMAPWYAEMLIAVADLERVGGRQALGVEEQISAGLPPGVKRRAFESAAQQIEMFAAASPREQADTLVQSLKEMESEPDAFAQLQKAWVAGDVGSIERQSIAPMRRKAPRLYRRMVTSRNRAWTATIESLLKGSEQAFIVVGVGHLIGPDSVPVMLRKKGFAVEGP